MIIEKEFSFEYCIDPKDHKSEVEIKAIAVEGAMQPRFLLIGQSPVSLASIFIGACFKHFYSF